MNKKLKRLRRARRVRARVATTGRHRLTVFRTPKHIYAQLFAPDEARVLASASTVEKGLRDSVGYGGNSDAAATIGKTIAERAIALGVTEVAFDRSGFLYHGRIKALADAARETGLKF